MILELRVNRGRMSSGPMLAWRYQFGLFELDANCRELRRESVLVRLQAQPAQVLVYLVERAGQVVSREELRKAVWGDATFVDFEAGLNFCISQIRSVLRDDAAQPLYIRTVPKAGYQFIAPVERVRNDAGKSQPAVAAETEASDSGPAKPNIPASGAAAAHRPEDRAAARRDRILPWIAAGTLAAVLLAAGWWAWRGRRVASAERAPILAVARFDNETGEAALNRFADGLTDNVVEQLTVRGGGNYRVIGNAQILRVPREQRDLRAIGASLGAGYVVLGQVEANGEQLRMLVHLIRLPDQTHIWVVRLDRPRGDEWKLEAEAAEKIAAEFAERMAERPEKAPSFAPGSH